MIYIFYFNNCLRLQQTIEKIKKRCYILSKFFVYLKTMPIVSILKIWEQINIAEFGLLFECIFQYKHLIRNDR